jgi:phosphate butyryltransferase
MVLKTLDQILEKALKNKPKRLVVAAAEELHVLEAIKIAFAKKIITPILIGNTEKIKNIASNIDFNLGASELIYVPNSEEASKKAVWMIRNKEADILMKGMVATSTLMKAVIDHEYGIRKNVLLSHVALCQIESYHKILSITDAALNIKPGLEEKCQILLNAINLLNNLGYNEPKVAIVCPVEKENPKIESTTHAILIKSMNKSGEIKNCIIDGPLALDNIISKDAALIKSIQGVVAGDADLILTPDLDSGNILYKSIIYLAGGIVAAIITGAAAPIVLTSRADSEKSKLYSIALAASI